MKKKSLQKHSFEEGPVARGKPTVLVGKRGHFQGKKGKELGGEKDLVTLPCLPSVYQKKFFPG